MANQILVKADGPTDQITEMTDHILHHRQVFTGSEVSPKIFFL